MKKKIKLYVNGFPKSGTTWVVRLLASCLDSYAYGNGFRDSAFDEYWNNEGEYYIIHTHAKDMSELGPSGWKMIYVIRDFRDVIISSFFHHYRINEDLILPLSSTGANKINSWLWRNIVFRLETYKLIWCWGALSGGDSLLKFTFGLFRLNWTKSFQHSSLGSWSNHVDFWTKKRDNIVVVRYEDLLQDTERALTQLVSRLGITVSEKQISEAVKLNRFENQKEKFEENSDSIKAIHLRRGVSGDWVRFLDNGMLHLIRKNHGEIMNTHGYKI